MLTNEGFQKHESFWRYCLNTTTTLTRLGIGAGWAAVAKVCMRDICTHRDYFTILFDFNSFQ